MKGELKNMILSLCLIGFISLIILICLLPMRLSIDRKTYIEFLNIPFERLYSKYDYLSYKQCISLIETRLKDFDRKDISINYKENKCLVKDKTGNIILRLKENEIMLYKDKYVLFRNWFAWNKYTIWLNKKIKRMLSTERHIEGLFDEKSINIEKAKELL